MALLAPGYDVVVKGLKVPVVDDGNPKGSVLATILGGAADGGIWEERNPGVPVFDVALLDRAIKRSVTGSVNAFSGEP